MPLHRNKQLGTLNNCPIWVSKIPPNVLILTCNHNSVPITKAAFQKLECYVKNNTDWNIQFNKRGPKVKVKIND